MKNLSIYLKENIEHIHGSNNEPISEAWTVYAGWPEVVEYFNEYCVGLFTADDLIEIHDQLAEAWKELDLNEWYKLQSTGKDKFIKIPRMAGDMGIKLQEKFGDGKSSVLSYNSNKETLSYIKNNKLIKFGILGNGSRDTSLTVNEHEPCSCFIFNTYVADQISGSKSFNIDDLEHIKMRALDFLSKEDLSNDWLNTFQAHTKQFINFLKAANCEVTDYEATQIGFSAKNKLEGIDLARQTQIAQAYSKFVVEYQKVLNKDKVTNKNLVDPTDVILYRRNDVNTICKLLKEYSSEKNKEKMLQLYKDELFAKRLIIGVSLKQTADKNRVPVIYNGSEDDEMYVVPVVKTSKAKLNMSDKSYKIECTGKYQFGKITDPENNEVDNKLLYLTLRSNQSSGLSGVMMDVQFPHHPSNGKVPVSLWRQYVYVDTKDYKNTESDKKRLMAAYKDKIESWVSNPNFNSQADELILAGIKCLKTCMPYILVN